MTGNQRKQRLSNTALNQTRTAPSDDLPDFMPWVLLMQAIMEAKHFEVSNAVLPAAHGGKIKKIAIRIKKTKA
jgi:hypothetical protein